MALIWAHDCLSWVPAPCIAPLCPDLFSHHHLPAVVCCFLQLNNKKKGLDQLADCSEQNFFTHIILTRLHFFPMPPNHSTLRIWFIPIHSFLKETGTEEEFHFCNNSFLASAIFLRQTRRPSNVPSELLWQCQTIKRSTNQSFHTA